MGIAAAIRRFRPGLALITGVIMTAALFTAGYLLTIRSVQRPAPLEFQTAYDVVVDDRVVAKVADPEVVDTAMVTILETASYEQGMAVMPVQELQVREVRVRTDYPLLDELALQVRMAPLFTFKAYAAAIRVDGRNAVYLSSRQQAEEAVARLFEDFTRQLRDDAFGSPGRGRINEEMELVEAEVLESIEVVDAAADPEAVVDVDRAVAILQRGTDRVLTHTVQQGESLWTIASRNNMSVSTLEQANPEIDNPNRLQVGQELNLIVAEPYVTVRSEEIRSYQRNIAFRTQYVYDDTMWPWQTRTQQAGSHGVAEVTEVVIRENGAVVDRKVIRDEVVREPQVQILVLGSKEVPEYGTGQFIWPLEPGAGRLTSGYGWRHGRFHHGIDLGAPTGTPVRAVDGGMVTHAGSRSAYGLTIIVDHGGGRLTTLYAHLSALLVGVGDRVEQGQVIGRVGSTGRSTGPHLHFEVRIDGSSVNPLQYYP